MKFVRSKIIFYLVILLVFYFGLFLFCRGKILFTPDLGLSDIYHGDIPAKFYLGEIFKKNSLPFWTDKIGNGYPLLSDNLFGSLFLPNIIILKFFPFGVGYNLLYLTALLSITAGFFFILLELKTNPLLSLLLSLNFTFNGAVSLRLVHLSVLQPFSLFPFLFLFLYLYLKKNHPGHFCLSVFLMAQIILAGHTQIVFITVLSAFVFLSVYLLTEKDMGLKEKSDKFFRFAMVFVFAFAVTLYQILPAAKLQLFVKRNINLDFHTATSFSISWSSLVNFFSPFAFGNPKLGSFNFFTANRDIFWENTPYIGRWLFFLLAAAVFFGRRSKRPAAVFLIPLVLLVFLSLGKNSPIYFIFSFPPFSYFRNQSRHLIFAVFFLYLFVAPYLSRLWAGHRIVKAALFFILIFNLFDLMKFAYDYHLFADYERVIRPPEIAAKTDRSRYITLGQLDRWNKTFLSKGWSDKEAVEDYLFFRNFLYPNSNLIYAKDSFDIYTPVTKFSRLNVFQNLTASGINSSKSKKIIGLLGIKYLISADRIDDRDFRLETVLPHRDMKIYLYRFLGYKENFFYVPQKLDKIVYLEELSDFLEKSGNLENSSLYENPVLGKLSAGQTKFKIFDRGYGEDRIWLDGEFSQDTMVVFKKNYYPEWKAYANGREIGVYPINLIHMGMIVPAGRQKLRVIYQPNSFRQGLILSLISGGLLIGYCRRLKFFPEA